MAQEKGRQQYVAVKNETARLTAETTGFTRYLPFENFSSKNTPKYFEDRRGYASRGGLLNKVKHYSNGDGTIDGVIDADEINWALYHAFGSGTPTTADGATTWVYSLLESTQLPTFTTQFTAGDEGDKRLRGCSVSNLTLTWTPDAFTYSVTLVAVAEETGNSLTPVYTKPQRYLLPSDVNCYFASNLAGLGSVSSPTGTEIKLKSCTISIDTGVTAIQEFSTNTPTDVLANGHDVTLEMETYLKTSNSSAALQTGFDADTKYAFRIHAVASELADIGASSLKPTLSLAFPESSIDLTRSIPRDEYLEQSFSVMIERPELIVPTLIDEISAVE